MPKQRVRVPFGDWTGGLNEDDAPGALQATELRIARNVYWKGRALSSRPGFDLLQSSAINSGAAGTGIWEFVRSQGASRDVLAVFGNKLYKGAKDAAPTDITGAVTITAGQNKQIAFDSFNDTALMVNGTDNPWKWTGAGNAAALGGSPPAFATILSKWNRVFGAGHAAAARTIRFSNVGDPETWGAGNTVPAVLGDASAAAEGRDYILQLGHLGDSMFVGLRQSIGRVLYTGDATTPFRYNQLAEFGMEGQTYLAIGPMGYFLSKRGVHRIQPSDILITYESSEISGRRLRSFWRDLNLNRIQYSRGTVFRTRDGNTVLIWPLTTGTGSIHDVVLVMDVTDGPGTERFTVWTGFDANAATAAANASTLVEELLFTTTTGFVGQGDVGTDDNGAAFVAEAASRWEDFGLPSQEKKFRDLYIEGKATGTQVNVQTFFDYRTTASQNQTFTLAGDGQAAWGSFVWGTGIWANQGIVKRHLPGVGSGVVSSHRVYTDGANQPWTLYKLVPSVKPGAESIEAA